MENQMSTTTPFVPPPINQHGRLDAGAYLDRMLAVYSIVLLIMQVIAMPSEVLMRRRFGERYLDPLMILLGYGAIVVLGIMGSMGSGGRAYSVLAFANLYLAAVAVHKLAILHRNLKGERWHSHSDGLSWTVLTIPARLAGDLAGMLVPVGMVGPGYRDRLCHAVREIVHLVFEPALVVLVGVSLHLMDMRVGVVLCWSGFALFVKGSLKHQQERVRVLDMVDGAIEAEYRGDVLAGSKPAEETEGYKVTGVPLSHTVRDSVTAAFTRLDPALRAMVANDAGPGATQPSAVMGDNR